MALEVTCVSCKSDISVSGYDDKDSIVIYCKCRNCLANLKIEKEEGEVIHMECVGQGEADKGVTTALGAYPLAETVVTTKGENTPINVPKKEE